MRKRQQARSPSWKSLRPPASLLDRASKGLGSILPWDLLVRCFRAWSQAWPWTLFWASLFALSSVLFRTVVPPSASLLTKAAATVLFFGLWAFTEAAVMISAGHVFTGSAGGLARPARELPTCAPPWRWVALVEPSSRRRSCGMADASRARGHARFRTKRTTPAPSPLAPEPGSTPTGAPPRPAEHALVAAD